MATAKHARPRTNPLRALLKGTALLAATTAVTAAVTVPIGLAAHTMRPAELSQATTTAYVTRTASWWDGRTCEAFMASHGQPGRPGYRAMIRDARHADTYLRVDVALLAKHYSGTNARYVRIDCTMTPDQAASQ